jgi:hypothetical protein
MEIYMPIKYGALLSVWHYRGGGYMALEVNIRATEQFFSD